MKPIRLTFPAVLLLVSSMFAQGGAPAAGGVQTMTLTGSVYDPNGSVIVNGLKLVASGAGGKSYEATVSDEGIYTVTLPLGVYRIKAAAPGFCNGQVERFRVVNATYGKMSLDFVLDVPDAREQCGPGTGEKKPGRKRPGKPGIILE
ncbi:MAG: carboxypeptidase regulatory-like domain-containing protein [Acidobacteria bacterium]|nr:carboxypeptidase regulatory-like domain-containing protein [Acidobacteriota bacterium]